MKEKSILAIVFIFMAFVSVKSVSLYLHEQSNTKRLMYDLKAARDSAQTFTTRDGHQASKLISQNLTAPELKRINPEVVSQLKNMYIAPRLVQSYTEATQEIKAEIKTPVTIERDTTATRNPQPVTRIDYRDKWISISGVVDPDTAKITVLAKDTIFTAIYKGERRHPWAWILSRRQYTAAATNRSPYIKIKVIQSGVIKQ